MGKLRPGGHTLLVLGRSPSTHPWGLQHDYLKQESRLPRDVHLQNEMEVVPGDRRLSVRYVAASFAALAWVAYSLRCFVRLKLVKVFGWDDGLMGVALIFYTVFCACMITASHHGTGQHEANLTPESIVIALRLWWLCEVFYSLASVALKASICLFLLRLTVRRLHIWILYLVMVTTVLTGIVFMLVLLLQCHPISHFWERGQEGRCISWTVIIAMSWLWSVFAGMCDFTVGILPIFLVKDLQMDRRTKFALVGILGVACIASSATIIRMPFLHTFSDPDFLWATTDIALWTNIEVGLGIVAGSVATLRPLLRLIQNKGRQYLSDQYPNASRLPSSNHNNKSFKRMPSEQHLARIFQPESRGNTMTTVQSSARGYESNGTGNGSDNALNQMPQIQDPSREYFVLKTFEVTASERAPARNT